MAEALLRERLVRAAIPGTSSSAGLLYDGEPASPGSVEAMRRRGIDLSQHSSRIMKPEHLEYADLILTMARVHLREAAVLHRSAFPRMYTLKEFVRRADQAPAIGQGQSFEEWLVQLSSTRKATELLGDSTLDDVADPIGRPFEFYERTAAELSILLDHVARIVPALGGPAGHLGIDLGDEAWPA